MQEMDQCLKEVESLDSQIGRANEDISEQENRIERLKERVEKKLGAD